MGTIGGVGGARELAGEVGLSEDHVTVRRTSGRVGLIEQRDVFRLTVVVREWNATHVAQGACLCGDETNRNMRVPGNDRDRMGGYRSGWQSERQARGVINQLLLLSIPFQGWPIFKYIIGGSEEVAAAQIADDAFPTQSQPSHCPGRIASPWGGVGEGGHYVNFRDSLQQVKGIGTLVSKQELW